MWASPTQREIVATAIAYINQTEDSLRAIESLDEWKTIRKRFVDVLETGLAGIPQEASLDAHVVSRHTFGDLAIENVLFRSAIGWQINGTIFRPVGDETLPGIVCPTGSSTKLNYQYWSSAQLIARSGYVVFSYDPPGFVGERRDGSDMFAHAPLGYLTGLFPRSFFIYDNAAAIDYLASRDDVAHDCGYAVSGLSLGAQTTVNAAIHDPRIKFIAPVCGAMSNFDYLLSQLYTVSCIDMVPDIMHAGLDAARKLSLCAPTPCLLIGGAMDEVFTPESTRNVFEMAKPIYSLYDRAGDIELYIDAEVGHTYSPAMVNEVVARLDYRLKHIGNAGQSSTYNYTADDVIEIPVEAMKAHPDTSMNACTLNAKWATEKRNARMNAHGVNVNALAEALSELLRLDTRAIESVEVTIIEEAVRSWVHDFTRLRIDGTGYSVPSVLVERAGTRNAPGMVFVDEAGVWAGIAGNGYLSKAFRFLDRTEIETEPVVLSIDAAGFGTSAHRFSAYDATSWSDPDSTVAYLGFAAGVPVAGLRVRDALAALTTLSTNASVDPSKLIVAGIGEGAITALFASIIHGGCVRTILVEPPVSFEEIAKAGNHTWPRSSFVNNILSLADIPELAHAVTGAAHVIRPMDPQRSPVSKETAISIYQSAGEIARSGGSGSSPVLSFAKTIEDRDIAFTKAVLAPY
jgi:hypothetical protein